MKNVSEIREQIHEINRLYGLNLTEDSIPFDDQKTWDTISRGDTLGIFQMASNVAIPVLKKVKPQNIEELSAVNAFIRPGASGLDEYLEGKLDSNKIRKLDPRLDKHLAKTYGAITYQEQIMFLTSELLGISFGEADLYRRALEKPDKGKNVQVVAEFNEKAVTVGVERGFTQMVYDSNDKKEKMVCELVRDLIVLNSGYGFNKSHSIAYAIISYWTAWIKTNYPLVFYTTMFNGNLDALPEFMEEARKNGITIKSPHVGYSRYDSIIEDEENRVIRIGLNSVKGIGPAAVESIVRTQPYVSMDDFFDRNNLRSVNKKVIEAGIKVNAFSGLGIDIDTSDIPEEIIEKFKVEDNENQVRVILNRNQLWNWYEQVGEFNTVKTIPKYAIPKNSLKGKYLDEQYGLIFESDGTVIVPEDKLELLSLKLENVEQYKTRKKPKGILKVSDEDEFLKKMSVFRRSFYVLRDNLISVEEDYLETYLKETEEFGFSFLPHPLEKFSRNIPLYEDIKDGNMMQTAGIITEILTRVAKNKSKYYWVIIQTPKDKVRITFWHQQYEANKKIVKVRNLIKVTGVKTYGGINCETLTEIKL